VSGRWPSLRPYLEKESLAAFFVGVSSGFPYAMIGATLTTRLTQDGIDKRTVTAFALAFLVYNLKVFWAWIVDGVRIPLLGRLGQRVSWLLLAGFAVIAAVVNLALVDPAASIQATVVAAVLVGITGATYDIVIDAYRIETLKPYQLGVGSGMSQYGWRIGSAAAGAVALVVAGRMGWTAAYMACAVFALPAMLTGLIVGEPARHVAIEKRGLAAMWTSIVGPFKEFLQRNGAWLVLLFILVHKIGDTLALLTVRLLFNDLAYTNDEIAIYDVGFGFWAFLVGIFVGGILYTKLGLKRSLLLALVLMGLSISALRGSRLRATATGSSLPRSDSRTSRAAMAASSSSRTFRALQPAVHGRAVRADIRDRSVLGRVLTGTTAGSLIQSLGYVNFYLLTTALALPGILLFWFMMRKGMIDRALGTAGRGSE
jgi:PAT family beta-lactamase induction signal transducer AmpG